MPGMDAVYNHITAEMRQHLCDVLEDLWDRAVAQRRQLSLRVRPFSQQVLKPRAPLRRQLSLRPPQRRSLEILDRITEIAPPRKDSDVESALAAIRSEFPTVTDFEREFPSLCFALATGVGKTRLMGAFISYLHLALGIDNFFVLAPNLTIYNKLVADFTPTQPNTSLRASPSSQPMPLP